MIYRLITIQGKQLSINTYYNHIYSQTFTSSIGLAVNKHVSTVYLCNCYIHTFIVKMKTIPIFPFYLAYYLSKYETMLKSWEMSYFNIYHNIT